MEVTYSDVTKETITVTATITPLVQSNFTIQNQEVTFKIGDQTYKVNITNGVAKWNIATSELNLTHLAAGHYTITATYAGDDYHYGCENSTSFDISAREAWIKMVVENIIYGQYANITMTSNANGTFIFVINGKTTRRTFETNGTHSEYIAFDDKVPIVLKPGDYILDAIHIGDDYYGYAINATSFKVYKLNSTVNATPTTPIEFGDNETITVQVNENSSIRNASGYVKIIINGNEYSEQLNSTGGVTFHITGLTSGTYSNITLEYEGDEYFNGNSTNVTFVVNPRDDYIVNVRAFNITYGENETVYVSFPEGATGTAQIYIDGVYKGDAVYEPAVQLVN